MSGPATAAFSFAPFGGIALAALALREARQMGREYQEVVAEIKSRTDALNQAKDASQHARIHERKALRNRAQQSESRLERLRGLLIGLEAAAGVQYTGEVPVSRALLADRTTDGWRRQIEVQEAEAVRIQDFIRHHSPAICDFSAGDDITEFVPVEEALHIYMMHRAMHAQLDPSQSDAVHLMVARILARLELDVGEGVPVELDHLAKSIVLAPDLARAEILSMELRLQVQRLCESRATQQAGVAEARTLLAGMAEDVPHELEQLLEDVVAGERLMEAPLRELAQNALAAIEVQRKRLQEETAAHILEQSLRDLGYEVDGVENTFFIEGGVAHFQRHGWGEYFVRMRVGMDNKTLNFNVVRARGAFESAERKRLDSMAEDRWCSEFPKMLETLKARGIMLDVKRLLGAGELPVQVVDSSTLPASTSNEQQSAISKQQEIKRELRHKETWRN
jgi:hypothetical protein